MANYRTVVRYFPPALHYLRQRKWVRRGDVLAYAPGVRAPSFSTDALGFRHTNFQGRDIGIANIEDYGRLGLVLGSSHLFGFGLKANGETLPSRLSERFGYPFLGVVYPEADTRTLHATLFQLLRQAGKRIANVILITGGDFTRYCYVESADPLFGPPMLASDARSKQAAGSDTEFASFIHFTCFWTRACGELAKEAGVPLSLAEDVTFFEKSNPDATEAACELGVPRGELQTKVHLASASLCGILRRASQACRDLPPQAHKLPGASRASLHRRVSLPRREPVAHRRASRRADRLMPLQDYCLGCRLSSAASPSENPVSCATACSACPFSA